MDKIEVYVRDRKLQRKRYALNKKLNKFPNPYPGGYVSNAEMINQKFDKSSYDVDTYFNNRADRNVKRSKTLMKNTGRISGKIGLFRPQKAFEKEKKEQELKRKIQKFLIDQGCNASNASQKEQIDMLQTFLSKKNNRKSLKSQYVTKETEPFPNPMGQKKDMKVQQKIAKKEEEGKVKEMVKEKELPEKKSMSPRETKHFNLHKKLKIMHKQALVLSKHDLFNKVEPKSADVQRFKSKKMSPIATRHEEFLKNSHSLLKDSHSQLHTKLENLHKQAGYFNDLLNKKNMKHTHVQSSVTTFIPKPFLLVKHN